MQFWKSLMVKKEKQTSEEHERIVKLKAKVTKNFGNTNNDLSPFKKEFPNVTNRKIHVDMDAPNAAVELVTKRKRNVSLHATKSPHQEEESKTVTKTGQKSRKNSLPLVFQPETLKSPFFSQEEASKIIQKQFERQKRQKKLRSLTKTILTLEII
jgi:hypothetical protein